MTTFKKIRAGAIIQAEAESLEINQAEIEEATMRAINDQEFAEDNPYRRAYKAMLLTGESQPEPTSMTLEVEVCLLDEGDFVCVKLANKASISSALTVDLALYDLIIKQCPVFTKEGQFYAWTGLEKEQMPHYPLHQLQTDYED